MSNRTPDKHGQQPPPKTVKGGVSCNVFLLDGESIQIFLDKNDCGKDLFDKVCSHLDLVEKDYFGLTYTDDRGPSHLKYWLNLDKKISKQKKRGAWVFDFALKFYPPDPTHLRESLTRWLIVLQVRRDLLSGRLPCTFTTYALLGSYNVQADVGEHDGNEHGSSYEYIKDMTFAPNQTPELLEKIAELHKQHRGQTPDESERCFLDNAKKLSMYGVDLHKAKDSDNNAIMLGVCASGVLIYRDKLRINRFVWPKILKLSYKRNHFYIKIRPGELERSESTIMFKLDNHRLAKRLWKTCVEHHAFFRLRESDKPNSNPTFPRFGSKFRYSGRTLFQTRQTAALLDRPPPFFERSQPNRDSYSDAANRSRSVDELAGRRNKDPYGDGIYDPNDPRYNDGKDKRDLKGGPPGYGTYGRDGDYRSDGEGGTLQRRPYDTNEDRRDRLPSNDATLERDRHQGQGRGDDSMDVTAGGVAKPETEKERRKREKEEDKRRKKEAEEKKKKEEEERKRAEEERKRAEEERKRLEKERKKKGGKGDTAEDLQDRLGQGQATETTFGVDPGSLGLDNGADQRRNPDGTLKAEFASGVEGDESKSYTSSLTMGGKNPQDPDADDGKKRKIGGLSGSQKDKHANGADSTGQRDSKGNFIGPGPYGVGMGVGKGDLTGVVGEEGYVDNKQGFLPLTEPIKGTKSTLKGGYTDNTMPFFHPAATSTVGRSKIPPPVPPKSANHSLDDSFNRNDYKTEKGGVEEIRVQQRVVMAGDEEDDFDFDAALSDAIRSVTEFNPDMSVERIECVQQIEDVKDGK